MSKWIHGLLSFNYGTIRRQRDEDCVVIILIDQNSKMAKVKGKGSHWLKKIIIY